MKTEVISIEKLLNTIQNQEEKLEDKEIKIEFIRKKGGRRKPPKDLPRVRVEHDIDEDEKICNCGCKKKK